MFRPTLAAWVTAIGAFAAVSAFAQTSGPIDPSLFGALKWRNLGPFRGGRVSAVTGVIGQPGVFYMGLPAGGVWKTTSAGTTWFPVFDDIRDASSVGAIEVAPSDPNVIYVGMGDMVTGGAINEGNGVYKSTDAGKTWVHLGLDRVKQIPSILVDPHNPDIVMVAAQGNLHAKSTDRGLYRSTDGGKTWKKTLYVDDQTGVQKITWAYDHPEVMLATTVRHYQAPGAAGRGGGFGGGGQQGDPSTRLYKSTDEGLTWKQLDDDSMPDMAGRTCVAIANGTDAKRMFLVGNFGLYRSDDGGNSWRQMDASDRRVANGQGGYNCGVYVNPQDPDTVYVVNTCLYISHDGGKTFTGFKGAPGGDDPQQLWLDPTDGKRILLGSDQGSTITLDGGLNWSSWYNQATAQVYHISTDNRFPYWVYATQQDSGSIGTSSRGNLGEITPLDWLPHPGYEFGSIVADPRDPNITYAGGPGRGIIKVTYPSGEWINVSPVVDSGLGLRSVGNQPLMYSQTNPRELFAGFQYLMATTDGGHHWKKLSPDLGYPKGVTPPKPGETPPATRPATPGTPPAPGMTDPKTAKPDAKKNSGVGAQDLDEDAQSAMEEDEDDDAEPDSQFGPGGGGSIESFSPSSVDGNVIWVGTSNGLIKVTKNHGGTWEDVTIPKLPNPTRADISAIDSSHQDPATAYVAIDYHTTGDFTPFFYRTHDFGKTWTKIVDGLPTDLASGSFARVIRADTKRPGLLFAGTESSVYVSFNDGDKWEPLGLNAPVTSYRDMTVHGNDLVVGTYGRGFWVLDDISPLRQVAATMATEPTHLFKPGDAIRVRRNVNGDTPFPPEIPHALNPPDGAIIYYYLSKAPAAPITLDVTDAAGHAVRHMTSAPITTANEPPPPVPDFWVEKPQPLPANAGMSRVNWNLRYDSPPSSFHSYEINANPGQTPASPEGPLVEPGTYTVTLTVDGQPYRQTVNVLPDPRGPVRNGDVHAQHVLQMKLYDGILAAWKTRAQVDEMRNAVAACGKASTDPAVTKAVTDFQAKLTTLAGAAGRGRGFGGGGPRGAPQGPRPPSFMGAAGALTSRLSAVDSGDMAPNEPTIKASAAAFEELKKANDTWKELNEKDLPAFNAVVSKFNVKPVPRAPL